jgi:hypothetical protein
LERFAGIRDTPGVSPSYVGIRHKMASLRRSVPYPRDATFRAIESDEYQVDYISPRLGYGDERQPTIARESCFNRKIDFPVEIV